MKKWKIVNNFDNPRETYVPEYRIVEEGQNEDHRGICTVRFTSHHYMKEGTTFENNPQRIEAEKVARIIRAAQEMHSELLLIRAGLETGIDRDHLFKQADKAARLVFKD